MNGKLLLKNAVGIIIVNWKQAHLTIECVQSIKTHVRHPFVIIVVDNASADDSVEKISRAHPDVEIVQSTVNRGFGGGNNLGFEYLKQYNCTYVWLLNNDTVVMDDALSELVSCAEASPMTALVGCRLFYDRDFETIQAWGGGTVNPISGFSRHYTRPEELGKYSYITAASLLVRVSAIAGSKLFDEVFFMYWEDVDLNYRLKNLGWKIQVCDHAAVVHFESSSLGKSSLKTKKMLHKSSQIFYRRHFLFYHLAVFISVLKLILLNIWFGIKK